MVILRLITMVAVTLALTSCTQLEQWLPHSQTKHKSVKHNNNSAKNAKGKTAPGFYSAGSYVQHLTLARLALENTDDDTSSATSDLIMLQNYSESSPQSAKQAIVVLEYHAKDDSQREIIAPVGGSLTGLSGIINRLRDKAYTLYELRVVSVTVAPDSSVDWLQPDAEAIRSKLAEQQNAMLSSAEKLSPVEDAKLQLQLIRFFIDQRCRDAAYLTVDNVKHLLATATAPEDAETVKALSKQLETLEGQLHKTMPFTLH